jgi:hypothetical protein
MVEILYTKLQFCDLYIRWNNLCYTHQKPVFTQLPFNCIYCNFWRSSFSFVLQEAVLYDLFYASSNFITKFQPAFVSNYSQTSSLCLCWRQSELLPVSCPLYTYPIPLYTNLFCIWDVTEKMHIPPKWYVQWTWQSSLCKHGSLDASSLHYGPFPWQEEYKKSTDLSTGLVYLGITDFIVLLKISLAQVNHHVHDGTSCTSQPPPWMCVCKLCFAQNNDWTDAATFRSLSKHAMGERPIFAHVTD